MKCIKCQNDSKYSERTDGKCPKCQHKFAFEPKNGDVFTDPAFSAALDRVSADGAVRFTESNLYYELARTKRGTSSKSAFIGFGVSALVIGAMAAVAWESLVVLGVGLVASALLIVRGLTWKRPETPQLSRDVFVSALHKWNTAHGAPARLVQRVARASGKDSKKALPSELATYSFDRAVICDSPETVDLLLANNFHFENNCAILSVTRYPEAVFEPVLEMLRRNPKIEVFALHDASVEGHDLARMLATSPQWFKGIGNVTDVGILVRHAARMRGLWKATPQMQRPRFPDLSAAENAWLSMYSIELAAIRPEQIIKRLFRAMTQPGEKVTTDDGGFFFVGGSFGGSDAGTSDGGGDSFG